jgi:hypothetical protein
MVGMKNAIRARRLRRASQTECRHMLIRSQHATALEMMVFVWCDGANATDAARSAVVIAIGGNNG